MRMKKLAAVVLCCAPALALTACSKPEESKVHDAIVKDVQENAGASEEQATQFADCAAPQLHEKLGSSSLDTIIEEGISSEAEIDADDADEANKIIEECGKEAGLL